MKNVTDQKYYYILIVIVYISSQSCTPEKEPTLACDNYVVSIVIDSSNSKLYLCQNKKILKEYPIAYGRKGMGKQKKGDMRTPLGIYTLGKPRKSQKYGTFIPINYPTKAQKRNGYTGSAIGIHGPNRKFTWLGKLNTLVNWTQGCIAVGTDSEIEKIANTVSNKKIQIIEIK